MHRGEVFGFVGPNGAGNTTTIRMALGLGSVGREVLKLRRQGMVWAMLGLALFFFAVVSGALTQADALKQQFARSPATFIFNLLDYLTLFDTGSGIFLLIVGARLVGMEYSDGTIRVLLARGAGRLRLLLAKLTNRARAAGAGPACRVHDAGRRGGVRRSLAGQAASTRSARCQRCGPTSASTS